MAVHPEVLLEGHTSGDEVQVGNTHTDRRRSDSRYAATGARRKRGTPGGEREEIQPIYVDVGAVEKVVEIFRRHAAREPSDLQARVDVPRHLGNDIEFG